MAATKVFTIGEVLTASDLNSNFDKLPFSTSAFTFTYGTAIAPNASVTVAIALPVARFSVAPIVTVSSNDQYLTAYVSAISSGTATIGLKNNGAGSSGTAIITGFAVQMTSGTAAG
jgi:hypothetical protein